MTFASDLLRPGPLRTLAASTLVNNTGNGAFAAGAVVYLHQVVGLSAGLIGTGLTVAALVGLLASLPAGLLADRANPAVAAGVLAILAGCVSALYAVVDSALVFFLVASVFTLLERAARVTRQALVGVVFDGADRTAARARLRSVTNIGAALGSALAALALGLGSREAFQTLFLANALTFVLAGLLLLRVSGLVAAKSVDVESDQPDLEEVDRVLKDRPYAVVASLNALLTVHIVMLDVIVPIWVVTRTEAPHEVVAALLLANTIVVILFQYPVSRPFETITTAVGGLRIAGLLLAAMFALLALSGEASVWPAVALLVATVVAQTGAEMIQSASSWPLSYDLAPPGRIGEYQGVFSSAEQVVSIVAPAALTWVLFSWSGPGAIVLAVVYAVLALLIPLWVRPLVRTRASASQEA